MMQLDRAFARYRRGRDPAALGEVFDLAAPEVLRIATYLVRDGEVAEDLVQQTFLGAIEGAERFEDGRAVMPWLLGIMANQVRAHKRREAREPDANRLGHAQPDDPARIASDREIDATIRSTIDGIDEPYRSVLRMHLGEGLAPTEIASSLERPQGTVRSQLHRGLDLLRKALPVGLSLGIVSNTRGLAAVRADVLVHAGKWVGGAGAGAVAAQTAKGVVLMSKKSMVVIAAVLAVAALLGWEWLERDADDAPARHSDGRVDRVTPDAPEVPRGEAPKAMERDDPGNRELPEDQSYSVRVKVGGKRVAGIGVVARMLAFGDPRVYQRVVFTDAQGRAVFPDMPEGQVLLWTTTGAGVWEDASKTGSVDLADDAGISVRARVVDGNGVPVEGAVIEAAWTPGVLALPMARTGVDGRAFVPHLDREACLTARAPGWVAPPLQVVSGRGGDVVDLTFKLVEPGGSAQLTVVDPAGQPIPGAVAFDHAEIKARSGETPPARSEGDQDGRVTFEGLAAGKHDLIVRAPGRRPTQASVVITPGSVTEQTVVMERSAVVSGRVTWANADAVARIPVEQVRNPGPHSLLDAMTFCDAQGRFRLDEIAPESFELQVRRPGFPAATRSFRLAPGQEAVWDVTLGQKHELRGRLTNAKGEPLAGWVVRALTPDRLQATTMTGADGEFALSVNDPEATYRLAAQSTSGNGGWRAQTKAKGTRVPVELIVRDKPKSRILGKLVNADGKPLGGVHVMAMAVEGNGLKVVPTSHKDGGFLFPDLPAGRYRFAVVDMTGTHPTVPIGEHEYRAGEQLDLGATRVSQGGRVRIRVRLAEGMRPTGAGISEWWAGVLQGWKSEEDGARLSPLVAPGVVKVVASGMLDRQVINKRAEVVVRDGETTEVTIDLRETESK